MKKYRYKAKKGPSRIEEGILVAASRDEVVDKINELGMIPVDVEEVTVDVSGKKTRKVKKKASRVGVRELSTFYRHLARLVRSGVPILSALSLMLEASENLFMKEVVEEIRDHVRQGDSLSEAMSVYPRVFTSFDLGLIQTGEHAGKLDEALVRLSQYHEGQAALLSKIRTALAYPVFIFIVGTLTLSFLFAYVIPQFSMFFKDLGQDLPGITRALIWLSERVRAGWIIFPALVLFLWLYLKRTLAIPAEKLKLDRLLLKLPLIGSLFLKADIARVARTLELLLSSGIPVLQAVRISIPSIKNEVIKKDLQACYAVLEDGGYFSEGLKQSAVFPVFVSHLISIGEESGRLDQALGEIADWYEKDTEEAVKLMTGLLEPVMMLMLGITIAFIVFAVLLPVFSINALAV